MTLLFGDIPQNQTAEQIQQTANATVGGGLQYNQIPGSPTYVPPNVSSPVSTSTLTAPSLNLPTGGTPDNGSSAVASAISGANAGNPVTDGSTTPNLDMATTGDYTTDPGYQTAQKQYDQSVTGYESAANALPSQADLLTKAQNSTGATQDLTAVNSLKTELASATAAYNNEFARTETKGVENGVPALFYQGEIAAKQRQAAVITTGIATRLAAAQDNWSQAESLAEKTASLQWADAQTKVDNMLKFVSLNQDNLSRAEKVAVSKMEVQAKKLQDQIDTYKSNMQLALTSGVKTQFVNKNGEFFNTANGQSYSNPTDFFKAAGVTSFAQGYAKGLITDINGETLANIDFAKQAQAKYPDVKITPNMTPAQVSQAIKGSRIYNKETYIAPSTTTQNDGIATTLALSAGKDGFVDPKTYLQIRSTAKINANEFDNRYGYLLSSNEQKNIGITASGKPPTDVQNTSAGYATRIAQAASVVDRLQSTIAGYNYAGYAAQNKLPSQFQSSNIQQQNQAELNFVNAVLRKESGAAISQSEYDNAARQYFPRPGDTAATLKQKQENRNSALVNLIRDSGPAANTINLNVKEKSSGRTGTIPANEFDPNLYELQ